MIDVDVIPNLILTKLLIEKLRSRNQRSGIVFISSVQVVSPVAGHSTYGGAKAYVDYLSKALAHENRDKIEVISG